MKPANFRTPETALGDKPDICLLRFHHGGDPVISPHILDITFSGQTILVNGWEPDHLGQRINYLKRALIIMIKK